MSDTTAPLRVLYLDDDQMALTLTQLNWCGKASTRNDVSRR